MSCLGSQRFRELGFKAVLDLVITVLRVQM